jgi:hypothetical protein
VVLGARTEFDRSTVPFRVTRLHVVAEGWLGDHLIAVPPCVIASSELCAAIGNAGCTGCHVRQMEFTRTDDPRAASMPEFLWLGIVGIAKTDDFGMSEDQHLVVSEKALKVIQSFPLGHCEVDDAENPLSFEERKRRIYKEAFAKLGIKPPRTL